jgi:O-acetyl-ADP-ribose deacetylase (regulator of RNase III)
MSVADRIRIEQGDITRIPADAIVNAANYALVGGGGVDGAIHRAGGPSLMEELGVIRVRDGGCPTGSAVVTGAGKLPAKFVFHAVGPVYRGGQQGEPEQLASCYRTCLKLAVDHGARTISFPAISTGAFRYPADQAAEIAVREVKAFLQTSDAIDAVIFALFDSSAVTL